VKKLDRGLIAGSVVIEEGLKVDAQLYVFLAPHSYTGDDVAEIHIHTNSAVTETLMGNLLERGLRTAEPGEFTARAYLNGKIDLGQAEAVNEIIVSSNEFQLAAAEKLLAGRLAKTTAEVRSELMDCLSLIEAGLDFSGEDIEFITREQAVQRLAAIKNRLEQLLSASSYESVIDLPAVGIAGAPNAGKSSLLNKLLGKERSIVSHEHKTTRDVLTGVCTLGHCRCVLFDCAGLVTRPEDILDELAQQAAIEALRNSAVVIFCVDVSKEGWSEDTAIRKLIHPKVVVPVATKCDFLSPGRMGYRGGSRSARTALSSLPKGCGNQPDHLAMLNESFSTDFLPVSAETNAGIELLQEIIDKKLTEKFDVPRVPVRDGQAYGGVALMVRHRKSVAEAIDHISESIDELKGRHDEVAAMMLRATYQAVSDIEQPAATHIDEQILGRIFSRFCIGK
jgi:tRNA modification GTPase